MRDTGISGLVRLAGRQAWRDSTHGPEITRILREAIHDPNPVVRQTAVRAIHVLDGALRPDQRVRHLVDLLDTETEAHVRDSLLHALAALRNTAPSEVDDALRHIAGNQANTAEPHDDAENSETEADLTAALALINNTPFAAEQLHSWASDPTIAPPLQHVVHMSRDLLAPNADHATQQRAFTALTKIAETATAAVTAPFQQAPTQAVSQRLKDAVHLVDSIADQVYFASGAYESKNGDPTTFTQEALERFADLAIPLLLTCAKTQQAPTIHTIVQTVIYLARLNHRRTLSVLSEVVTVGDAYTFDPMSGDVVIPYLKQLIAEHRDLVLTDPHGVEAFRHILTAFASAGSPAALELAFTFSDVFR